MGRSFNGTDQYYIRTPAILNAEPISMSGWFKVSDTVNQYTMASIADANSASTSYFRVTASGATSGDPVRAWKRNSSQAASSAGYTTGVWHHFVAVWAEGVRTIYLDGGNSGTNTTTVAAPTSIDNFTIGCLMRSSAEELFNGILADIALFNVALTSTDAADLYNLTKKPNEISGCVGYWILGEDGDGTEDSVGSYTLTAVNAPAAAGDHPYYLGGGTPTTVETDDTDRLGRCIGDQQGLGDVNYKKFFAKIALPSISGPFLSAELRYTLVPDTSVASLAISAYCLDTATWDDTTNYSTLDAISLGSPLASYTASGFVNIPKTHNVSAVVESAYSLPSSYVNFVLVATGWSGTLDYAGEDYYIGNSYELSGWLVQNIVLAVTYLAEEGPTTVYSVFAGVV